MARPPDRLIAAFLCWACLTLAAAEAASPGPDSPAPPPVPSPLPAAESPPSSPPPPESAPAASRPDRGEALEERLRRLEETNQKILKQYEAMERRHQERYEVLSRDFQDLQGRLKEREGVDEAQPEDAAIEGLDGGGGGGGGGGSGGNRGPGGGSGTIGRGTPSRGGGADGTAGDRVGAPPYAAPSSVRSGGDTTRGGGAGRGSQGTIGRRGGEGESRPLKVTIGNGVRFDSADEEFQLQFHNLTQAEMRNFPGLGGQSPLKSQFFIPRQRWYFTGRATRNIEFYTVINRGYGSLDLLDAFLNFNYDPRVQFRIGRTKTPTSYEYYQIAEGDLIAPERSLFIGNYAGNRQEGAMFHGQILDKRAEYAVGVFNGPRRSFGDFNNDKDLYTFFNVRPWQNSEAFTALKYMNLGGTYNFGNEQNPVQPSILTTANDQSSPASNAVLAGLSPTFLRFNTNIQESGNRAQWAGWAAWYYKSLNVLAEYDGGHQNYQVTGRRNRTDVGLQGFSTTIYYFLTGEEITRRVDVKPKHDFAFKNGRLTGIGGFEIYGRFSALDLSNNVFTGGLADRNLWSNHAQAIDVGLNWYLNRYTKIYINYQRAIFGDPVFNGPNTFTRGTNLFDLRFQLFF